jgi:hypothetical protein
LHRELHVLVGLACGGSFNESLGKSGWCIYDRLKGNSFTTLVSSETRTSGCDEWVLQAAINACSFYNRWSLL